MYLMRQGNHQTFQSMGGLKRKDGGWSRNRTGVHGVAVRCITTLPSSLKSQPSYVDGAGNEIRTRDPNLGKVVLYH